MKKITILTVLVISLLSTLSYSQTTVSIVAGVHSSSTSTNQNKLITTKPITHITGGIIIDQSIDKWLSVSSGINFKKKGFQISEATSVDVLGMSLPVGAKATTTIDYVEIPVLLKLNLNTNSTIMPYAAIGPSLSYAISGQVDTRATAILDFNVMSTPLKLDSPDYNRTQVTGNALAGVYLPYGSGHWVAELGYSKSFTDLISEDYIIDAGGKHKGWTFNVGFGTRF